MTFICYSRNSVALNAAHILGVRRVENYYDANSQHIGYKYVINMINTKHDEWHTNFRFSDTKMSKEDLKKHVENDRMEYLRFIVTHTEPGIHIFHAN